jgi:hypothetical protein
MTCPSGPPVTIVERNSPMNLYGMCDVMTSRVVVVAVRERERDDDKLELLSSEERLCTKSCVCPK